MTDTATGTFAIDLSPTDDGGAVSRMTLTKTFIGELVGTSSGQMLAFRTAVQGSAGYVAMEQVAGELAGRSGTFVLQHSGTMEAGDAQLQVSVVPDSATEGLVGLRGQMSIDIVEGVHNYTLRYAFTP